MFSSSSSIWSPVLALVPPERSTSAGHPSKAELVWRIEQISGADQRETADQRQFVILQQEDASCRSAA